MIAPIVVLVMVHDLLKETYICCMESADAAEIEYAASFRFFLCQISLKVPFKITAGKRNGILMAKRKDGDSLFLSFFSSHNFSMVIIII